MSQITVGITDKVRKNQTRGPPGGMSDIFNSYSEAPTVKDKNNGKLQNESEKTNNENNGHTEKKIRDENICPLVALLSLEPDSAEMMEKIKEIRQTQLITSVEVTNDEISNDNLKENEIVEESSKSTQKVVNNITNTDEKDCATPSRRNRVPPGGYSSGFW